MPLTKAQAQELESLFPKINDLGRDYATRHSPFYANRKHEVVEACQAFLDSIKRYVPADEYLQVERNFNAAIEKVQHVDWTVSETGMRHVLHQFFKNVMLERDRTSDGD